MAQPPDGVHVTYQSQYRTCGKPYCKCTHATHPGHGPYIYGFWRDPQTHKMRSTYFGKPLQPEKDNTHVNRAHHVNQH